MRARLIRIETRPSGVSVRREQRVEAEALRIGRGTENEIHLADLTVALHHGEFRRHGDGWFIESAGLNVLHVNGRPATARELRLGDVVGIANYRIALVEPGGDEDLALEIREAGRRLDDRQDLERRTVRGLGGGVVTVRRLAWLLFGVVAVALGALPFLSQRLQVAWSSGTVARPHSLVADDCASCHSEGFRRVRDADCLACHAGMGRHASPDLELAGLDATRCASCHREHNGRDGLAALEQRLCAECHADLSTRHPGTGLADAADFGDHHPEFQVSLVVDPGAPPRRTSWTPTLAERSGLAFDHRRHVGEVVSNPRTGFRGRLGCDACHQADPGGRDMIPIEFEQHCQSCHSISFDEALTEREAVHGNVDRMVADLREFYAARTLGIAPPAIGAATPKPETPPALRRERPGAASSGPRGEAAPPTASGAEEALHFLMVEEGRCALCHQVSLGASGSYAVAAVEIASRWLPRAAFTHGSHATFACEKCHPATRSENAADVLIPGRETCLECHGGARAGAPQVASECVACHPFHRPEHGPLRALVDTP